MHAATLLQPLKTKHCGALGSNPAGGTSLRNFRNSVFSALLVSLGGALKAVGPFYLVTIPGESKISHTGVNV